MQCKRTPFWRAGLSGLMLLAGIGTASAAPAKPVQAVVKTITVGSLTLKYCNSQYNGYCGSLVRPLDPTGALKGTVNIALEWYPRTDQTTPALGTILAEEGGPGFSDTGSRDGYVRLFTPLRDHRNIVLIDKRGTGKSDAIQCPSLQSSNEPGQAAVAACAQKLGTSAWMYGTELAVDDIAAVLDALQTGPVDYYGDSYGTYFGQVLAVRHASKVRTLVLDSAYPTVGQTPWFETEVGNGLPSLQKVCERSPSCAALGGSVSQRFQDLLDELRLMPITGSAPGVNGDPRTVTADAGALFLLFYNFGNSPTGYRDLDAAGRAYLEQNDPLPLLRLIAEAEDAELLGGLARGFSMGLYYSVLCSDYPQLYDLRQSYDVRQQQFEQSLTNEQASNPGVYSPFALDEAVNATTNPEAFDICLVWPKPPTWITPGQPVAPGQSFPAVPTLVLAGEFDTVTSPTEGQRTTALFPNSHYLQVPNGIHETAIGDAGWYVPPNGADLPNCVGPIVLNFVSTGGTLGDTSCLQSVRPIRTVPAFVRSFAQVSPAQALTGNAVDETGLRLASAAVETLGDAFSRYYVTFSAGDVGLRGGSWTMTASAVGYDFQLTGVKWTEDLSVSGTLRWDQGTGAVVADLQVAATGHSGTVTVSWNDRQTNASANLTGTVDGRALVAKRMAP